jgi:hypothetical protein
VEGAREFLARPEEIRREGWTTMVFRVKRTSPLSRSYVAIVREEGMARREDERGGGPS